MIRKKPLHEILQSTFFNVFHSAGIPMSVKQNEAIGQESRKLAEIIQAEIKISVIEKLEKVQERMIDAFKSADERIKCLEERVIKLEKTQERMVYASNSVDERLKSLEKQTMKNDPPEG